MKTTKPKKNLTNKKENSENLTNNLNKIQEEKHIEEEKKYVKPIENGTGITIVLSWDLLLWGLLYKRQIPYKVDKQTFLLLEHHCEVLGIAIRMA